MSLPAPSRISIIVARAANGVIGVRNALPWRLPEDLKYFRARTMGHAIVMGRKTWESLPRALPGRRNLVVSRQPGFNAQGAEVFASLEAALAECDEAEVFVIGGAQLYEAALPRADRLYITEIGQDFAGDTLFPTVDPDDWVEASRDAQVSENGLPFSFVVFDRAIHKE